MTDRGGPFVPLVMPAPEHISSYQSQNMAPPDLNRLGKRGI